MSKKQSSRGTITPISFGVDVNPNGLSVNAKSRAATAADRLVGGLFDWISSSVEHKTNLKDIEQRRIESIAAIKADGEISQARVREQAILDRDFQKQVSREDVVRRALELLQSEEYQNENENLDQLSDDWLNYFGDFAEKASSEQLKILWGKVLAGEIVKPGSYSIKTLRFIAELDQKTAELFVKYTKYFIIPDCILKNEQYAEDEFLEIIYLEEAGLFLGSSGNLSKSFSPDENGEINFTPVFEVGHHILRGKSNGKINFAVIKLTKVALELLPLLELPSELDVLELLGKKISNACTSLEIAKITEILESENGEIRQIYCVTVSSIK